MKTLLVVLLFLLSLSPAKAGGDKVLLFQNDQLTIRLFDKPCTAPEVLAQLRPDFHAQYRRADVVFQGKSYKACYFDQSDGSIFILDETGDQGAASIGDFKVEEGV